MPFLCWPKLALRRQSMYIVSAAHFRAAGVVVLGRFLTSAVNKWPKEGRLPTQSRQERGNTLSLLKLV